MIGRVNAGGGGGLQSTDAILRVIAPAGSTVTISKGGVSKSDAGHENASDPTFYDYYFIIHASQFDGVNPWTVTAVNGADTFTDTIIINSADEYDLELGHLLYFIKNGAVDQGMRFDNSTGWVTDAQGFQYLQSSDTGWHIAFQNVDLTDYKVLTITYNAIGAGQRFIGMWSTSTPSATTSMSGYTTLAASSVTNETAIYDISSQTGVKTIGFRVGGYGYNTLIKELALKG